MITVVNLINISSPHIVTTFCVMSVTKIYFLNKFPIFNTESLTVALMMYIRFLDLFILHNCDFIHFEQHLAFSPTSPS